MNRSQAKPAAKRISKPTAKKSVAKRTITTKTRHNSKQPASTRSIPISTISATLRPAFSLTPFTNQQRHLKVSADELKQGSVIKWEGDKLYKVQSIEKKMMGRRPTSLSVDLKCLTSGKLFPTRMMPADMVELEELSVKSLNFLYIEGEVGHLIDNDTFDQLEFPVEMLGKSADWIPTDSKLAVSFYEGQIFSIALPDSVVFEVTGEDKHGSAKIDWKSVILANNHRLEVPAFINVGEKVKVKLDNKSFMIRVNNED